MATPAELLRATGWKLNSGRNNAPQVCGRSPSFPEVRHTITKRELLACNVSGIGARQGSVCHASLASELLACKLPGVTQTRSEGSFAYIREAMAPFDECTHPRVANTLFVLRQNRLFRIPRDPLLLSNDLVYGSFGEGSLPRNRERPSRWRHTDGDRQSLSDSVASSLASSRPLREPGGAHRPPGNTGHDEHTRTAPALDRCVLGMGVHTVRGVSATSWLQGIAVTAVPHVGNVVGVESGSLMNLQQRLGGVSAGNAGVTVSRVAVRISRVACAHMPLPVGRSKKCS